MHPRDYVTRLALPALLLYGCLGADSKTTPSKVSDNYEIIKEEKYETNSKAQLVQYAVYKDSLYTKEKLEKVLMEIYDLNHDKGVFQSHNRPTVFGVYMYTSHNASEDKSEWIAMLTKGPNDAEPKINFNDFKITALNGLNDRLKTKDEIELEKLKEYLKQRGLELCTFSQLLKKIELDNIHKADARYPDYGNKHTAMVEQLDEQSYKDLRRKYNLNENVFVKVAIYAMCYCK